MNKKYSIIVLIVQVASIEYRLYQVFNSSLKTIFVAINLYVLWWFNYSIMINDYSGQSCENLTIILYYSRDII